MDIYNKLILISNNLHQFKEVINYTIILSIILNLSYFLDDSHNYIISKIIKEYNNFFGYCFRIGNNFLASCLGPSHGETISKQEAHKLEASIIGLFNPSMRDVSL